MVGISSRKWKCVKVSDFFISAEVVNEVKALVHYKTDTMWQYSEDKTFIFPKEARAAVCKEKFRQNFRCVQRLDMHIS